MMVPVTVAAEAVTCNIWAGHTGTEAYNTPERRQTTHTHIAQHTHTHSLSLASTHTYHSQWDILSFVAFIGFFDFVFSHSCIYFLPHTLPYTHPYISMDAHAHPHSTHTQTHPHTVSTDTKIPSLTSTCPPC